MSGFSNAVVGGAATLIRAAIQSANYVANTTGWRISRDGNVDMNAGTFRGTIVVGGGTVTLGATGIHVQGVTRQWDLNSTFGFLSRRTPDDGTSLQILDAGIFLKGQSPSINGGTVVSAQILGGNDNAGLDDTPFLRFFSPSMNGGTRSIFDLQGASLLGVPRNASLISDLINLQAPTVQMVGSTVTVNGGDIGRGWIAGGSTASNSAAIGNSETIYMATAQTTFFANRAYRAEIQGELTTSVAPQRPVLRLRQSSDGTSNLGTQIRASGKPTAVVSAMTDGSSYGIFTVGGSNVTTYIVGSITSASGTFTVTMLSGAMLNVHDIGLASKYPAAPVIV